MTLPSMRAGTASREFLRIAGGHGAAAAGSSPAGGLDVDNAGNLATDGDVSVDGTLDARGGRLENSTGDLLLAAQHSARDTLVRVLNESPGHVADVDVEGGLAVGGDVEIGGTLDMLGQVRLGLQTLTIQGGVVTVDSSFAILLSESGTSDELVTINGGQTGALLLVRPSGSHIVTLKHNVGNIYCWNGADVVLQYKRALLFYDAAKWFLIALQQ